jgi:hypothetical protein
MLHQSAAQHIRTDTKERSEEHMGGVLDWAVEHGHQSEYERPQAIRPRSGRAKERG